MLNLLHNEGDSVRESMRSVAPASCVPFPVFREAVVGFGLELLNIEYISYVSGDDFSASVISLGILF